MCDTLSNSVSWPEKRFKNGIKDARDASSEGLRALLTLNEVGPCLRTAVATGQFNRCPSLYCDDTQHDDVLLSLGHSWSIQSGRHETLKILSYCTCLRKRRDNTKADGKCYL